MADRVLAAAGVTCGRPWAVDLSGRVAVLAVDAEVENTGRADSETVSTALAVPPVTTSFRPMTEGDLPDLVRWTTAPHVARWWDRDSVDLPTARDRYGARLSGEDPTRMWVLEVDGRGVGLAQDYRIGDHPDYAVPTVEPDAIGFDYAIGDPDLVGRGIGTRLLWEYLRDVVRPAHPEAPTFFAAPDHRNAGSLRVLDKLGFDRGLWFDEPQPDGGSLTVVGCTLTVRRFLGRARSPRQVTSG